MEELQIDTFLKELGEDSGGISKPVLVVASNQKKYLLKNQNVFNPQTRQWEVHSSMFVQEFLINKLAAFLDITIPEFAIINVDKKHLEEAVTLQFTERYTPGKHFGSQFLSELDNNLMLGYQQLIMMRKPYIIKSWTAFFSNIENKEVIARIIALDLLIANFDRFTNMGNLIVANESGKRLVYAIDHGHAFYGAIWGTEKMNLLNTVSNSGDFIQQQINLFLQVNSSQRLNGLGSIFQAIEKHVDLSDPQNHDFLEVVFKIESLNQDILDSWFDEIPDEWFVEKNTQVGFYKKFLLTNKDNMRSLISILLSNGAFSNTTGGNLEWKELKADIQ